MKFKIPTADELKNNKTLNKRFKNLSLYDYLWKKDARSYSVGSAIGGFCSLLPMPFQMFLATPMCVYFRANLPISIALVWVSNPITMPFIMYAQYLLGCLILDTPVNNKDDIFEIISSSYTPFLTGAIVSALSLSLILYTSVYFYFNFKKS